MTQKPYNKRLLSTGTGALIGSLLGLLYWSEVGCTATQCFIAGDPFVAVGYGALMVGLLADEIFNRLKNNTNEHEYH